MWKFLIWLPAAYGIKCLIGNLQLCDNMSFCLPVGEQLHTVTVSSEEVFVYVNTKKIRKSMWINRHHFGFTALLYWPWNNGLTYSVQDFFVAFLLVFLGFFKAKPAVAGYVLLVYRNIWMSPYTGSYVLSNLYKILAQNCILKVLNNDVQQNKKNILLLSPLVKYGKWVWPQIRHSFSQFD